MGEIAQCDTERVIGSVFKGKGDVEFKLPPTEGINPRFLIGSSSWPWFNENSKQAARLKSCRCLRPLEVLSRTGIWPSRPCVQSIPWCYVDPLSGCKDRKIAVKPASLAFSTEACSAEKVAAPYLSYF